MAVMCKQVELHPNHITEWKRQLRANATDIFGGLSEHDEPEDLVPQHAKIGQLTLGKDFLERTLTNAGLLSTKP